LANSWRATSTNNLLVFETAIYLYGFCGFRLQNYAIILNEQKNFCATFLRKELNVYGSKK